MLPPLINRTVLKPDESMASLLIRLNRLNYYDSMVRITTLCRSLVPTSTWERPDPFREIKLVSELSLIEIEGLYNASIHRFSSILPSSEEDQAALAYENLLPLPAKVRHRHFWHQRNTQYCPLCLADQPYHRLSWFALALPTCEHHQCLLQRNCPHCAEPVTALSVMDNKCEKCLERLSDVAVIDLSEDRVGLQAQADLRALMYGQERPFLPHMPLEVVYQLIYGLAQASRLMRVSDGLHQPPFALPTSFDGTKTELTPQHAYVIFTTAVTALSDWPRNFTRYLGHYALNEDGESSGQVQKDFGRLYTVWLERNWRGSAYRFVQEAFEEFLCQNYVISPSTMRLRRVRKNPALLSRLPCITETETARMLGVSVLTVKKLVEQKKLQPYGTDVSSFNLLDRESVLYRLAQYRDTATLQETAELFGVSDRVIVDFIYAYKLKAVRGPIVDDSQEWLVSRPSALSLLRSLKQVTTKMPMLDMVPLQKAIQMVSAYGQNMFGVIDRLLTGQMRAFWVTNALPDICIAAEDIDVWLAELQANQHLISRFAFAQKMKIKRLHIIDRWVKTGLIEPVETTHKTAMHFSVEDVDRFVADYMWTAEAAEIMEVGVLTVQKWARHGRLHPVSGREVDGLHRYLFKREEIERFRPENRVTAPQMAKRLGIGRSQLLEWVKLEKIQPISGPSIDGMKHFLFLQQS